VAADLTLHHTSVRTPLGEFTIVASDVGIVATDFAEDRAGFLAWVEDRFGARVVRAPSGTLASARNEARAYFVGKVRTFRTRVDLRAVGTPFFRSVYEVTMAVPHGELRTYGDVAGAAGRPRAARAAGHAHRVCPGELWIPCHRIVPASPGFGTYGGHPERREFLLRHEGAI
jgi:methylated-DNA-[protein]-cysteine S-methyltransferase